MKFTLPHLDLISFWLGFVLATLFWLILLRIAKLIPRMRKSIKEIQILRQQRIDSSKEHDLRLFMLRKAQNFHLASVLFPLDQVLIAPSVITSPEYLPSVNEESDLNHLYSVLPYMPEVPALVVDFPVIKNSLLSILLAGQQHIAISAEPGFGKTTALAALTSQLCLLKTTKTQPDYLPIFFDYAEIDRSEENALHDLINCLVEHINGFSRTSIDNLLHAADSNHRLVLLIDGLDRLPLVELTKATHRVQQLQESFPQGIFVITCDPFITGDIENIGFEIFPLSAWEKKEKYQFLHQWKKAWCNLELTEEDKQRIDRSQHWLLQEENPASPFDLTIKTWLTFAGMVRNTSEPSYYSSYLALVSGGAIGQTTFEALALDADSTQYPVLPKDKALEILTNEMAAAENEIVVSKENIKTKSGLLRTEKPSTQTALERLEKNHFFELASDEKLLFSSLNLYAFLVSGNVYDADFSLLLETIFSPTKRLIFEKKHISQNDFLEIDSWLVDADQPLRQDHFLALTWLKQTVKGDPLRDKIFRQTARLLQDVSLPVGLRHRFLLPLIQTHDPTIASMLSYFSFSKEESIRQISAFGLGILNEEKYVPVLARLSKDPSLQVQKVACLSLNKIWTASAQSVLLDAVFTADESVRNLTGELFSRHDPDGHQILQELTTTDNSLARKAAIFGLAHIQEPWGNELLVKMSIEDTQWIVRDAAKFILEHPLPTTTFSPRKRIPVLENSWIIQKAEACNMILLNDEMPNELLFTILEKDLLDDKRLAAKYLSSQPTIKFIEQLKEISQNPQSDFREEAVNVLFCLRKRGLNLQGK